MLGGSEKTTSVPMSTIFLHFGKLKSLWLTNRTYLFDDWAP